jgi:hypothetical protein
MSQENLESEEKEATSDNNSDVDLKDHSQSTKKSNQSTAKVFFTRNKIMRRLCIRRKNLLLVMLLITPKILKKY